MTTILIADDHTVVKSGIKAILQGESDFKVVGEASDGTEAMRLAINHQPDIAVLDLMMNGMNGLEVARQLAKRSPNTGVVIFSMHANEGYVLEALRSGAKAYVVKDSAVNHLVKAIRAIAAGKRYLSPPISPKLIEEYESNSADTPLDPYEMLTLRESEVLNLMLQGHTNDEIANKLFISRRTVEAHRDHIMGKMSQIGVHNVNQLIHYVVQRQNHGEQIGATTDASPHQTPGSDANTARTAEKSPKPRRKKNELKK